MGVNRNPNRQPFDDMTRFLRPSFSSSRAPAPASRRPEPLSDDRYGDLLKRASAFFAAAVEASVEVSAEASAAASAALAAQRQAAIDEINGLMGRYGLTPDDLV